MRHAERVEIRHQRARRAERSLQLRDREKIVSRLDTLRATMLKLPRNLQQLVLALKQRLLKLRVGLLYLNRTSDRTVHLVVEIIQLLAQLPDLRVKMGLKIIARVGGKRDSPSQCVS